MRAIHWSAVALVAMLGFACRAPAQELSCIVERVVDGDTINCRGGRRVRLLLIDTPELNQAPYGRAARAYLLEQVSVGSAVTLETDVQLEDRYGRTLAHVKKANGESVNAAMLRAGYAVVLVYPPNVKHVDRYRAIQDSARVAKRGLWERSGFECLPVDRRRGRC